MSPNDGRTQPPLDDGSDTEQVSELRYPQDTSIIGRYRQHILNDRATDRTFA